MKSQKKKQLPTKAQVLKLIEKDWEEPIRARITKEEWEKDYKENE